MEGATEAKVASHAAESVTERERSTIDFPYTDLDNACAVVKGVHHVGGTACDYDQLAAHLGVEAKGGGFRLRVNGAKSYGLITYERGGRLSLTELGRRIVDPHQERDARVAAFLTVPLYAKVFEQFKGGPLPPQAGLERAIAGMGVGSKVKDKARQAMLRSAKQAGFLDAAPDRLVKPAVRQDAFGGADRSGDGAGEKIETKATIGGGGGGGDELHPLIRGILMTLPAPGNPWAAQEKVNWLKMAESIFKMIYPDSEHREIEITLSEVQSTTQ